MVKKKATKASPERHEPIVDGVVSLYASNGANTDAIDHLYANDVQFGAPDLTVDGRDAVKLLFGSFPLLFRNIAVEVNSCADTPTGIAIDMVVTYYPRLLPDMCKIEIRQWTTLDLNADKMITRHVDRWSLSDMLSHTTVVGSVYDKLRSSTGYASTALFSRLC